MDVNFIVRSSPEAHRWHLYTQPVLVSRTIMTAVQEQVVALINDAKLSTDKELIQSNLQQAFELVFNKDKSLLDEYYNIFLEFQTDKHGGVRKWLIGMIETVCKSSNNSERILLTLFFKITVCTVLSIRYMIGLIWRLVHLSK